MGAHPDLFPYPTPLGKKLTQPLYHVWARSHLRPTEGHTPDQGNARVSTCTYSPTPSTKDRNGSVHLLPHRLPEDHWSGGVVRGGTATKLTDGLNVDVNIKLALYCT